MFRSRSTSTSAGVVCRVVAGFGGSSAGFGCSPSGGTSGFGVSGRGGSARGGTGAGRGRGGALRAGSCGNVTGCGGSVSFVSTSRGGGEGISSGGGASGTVFALARTHPVAPTNASITTE